MTPSQDQPNRIVVVGAGHGGTAAASELRARGFAGALTLLSDEPVTPYERPPLSKAWLTQPDARKAPLLDEEGLAAREIVFRAGTRAHAVDTGERVVTLGDGERLAYDRLILATGSTARRLPVPGATLPGVHTLRTAADADALRAELRPGARLVVIGAGYIGLEVAASARRLGAAVTIAELAARPMARTASETIAAHYQAAHERHGVEFVFEDGVAGIEERDGRAGVVVLGSGRRIEADAVLLAAGGVADCALARSAGLTCEGGVVVNEAARTSDPAVYAVGDATARPSPFANGLIRLESVHNALEQARLAAAEITRTKPPRLEAPWFWSDQYDLKLQIAGLVREGDEQIVRRTEASLAVFHLDGDALRAVEAVGDPRAYMVGRKALTEGRTLRRDALADPSADLKTALV